MEFLRIILVWVRKFRHLALFDLLVHLLEEKLMIPRFDAKDETETKPLKIQNMRGIAAESVFGDNHLEVRVLPAKILEEAASCISFTIVFGCPILPRDHFGKKRNDFLVVRMDQGSHIHLLVIHFDAVTMRLAQTVRRGHLARRIIAGSVATQQIVPIEKGHGLQFLAALDLPEYAAESRSQG